MQTIRLFFGLAVATTLAAACATATPPPRGAPIVAPPPPGVAATSPAVLLTGAQLQLPAAPLPLDVPAGGMAPADSQQRWEHPVAGWIATGVGAVELSAQSPTRAARSLALLAIGMDAALQATERARVAGRPASDDAALAAAAVTILLATQPTLGSESMIARDAEAALWVGYWHGRDTPASVAEGQAIGRAAAAAVLAAAATDGAAQAPRTEMYARDRAGAPIPQAPGVWQPTPRMLQAGADPQWGMVRPLVLSSGAHARVPPPPAWDSPAFQAVRESFRTTQQQLTAADRALAWRWDMRQGTATPVGAWYLNARDLVLRERLDARASARVFAVLGVAINDSVIACWESKYHYRLARPIQWMQATADPHWLPPLVDTPNHPSYPSGHSAISAAAATVLARFFPADAAALDEQAHDASRSRVLGGIHWSIDTDAGFMQGQHVAELVISALGEPAPSASPSER